MNVTWDTTSKWIGWTKFCYFLGGYIVYDDISRTLTEATKGNMIIVCFCGNATGNIMVNPVDMDSPYVKFYRKLTTYKKYLWTYSEMWVSIFIVGNKGKIEDRGATWILL